MCEEEVADAEGHDLRTAVGIPILIEVRSVIKRSPSVARLDTTPFPFFLPDLTMDVPSVEKARATQLSQDWEYSSEGRTVFSAVCDDEGRLFLCERDLQSLRLRKSVGRMCCDFARDRHATLKKI